METYTNEGHGVVLENKKTAERLLELFEQKPLWTSKELNNILGWQFSQAVYSLRKKGKHILTQKIAPRQYAYELVN